MIHAKRVFSSSLTSLMCCPVSSAAPGGLNVRSSSSLEKCSHAEPLCLLLSLSSPSCGSAVLSLFVQSCRCVATQAHTSTHSLGPIQQESA